MVRNVLNVSAGLFVPDNLEIRHSYLLLIYNTTFNQTSRSMTVSAHMVLSHGPSARRRSLERVCMHTVVDEESGASAIKCGYAARGI